MPIVNTSYTSIVPKHYKTIALSDFLEERFSYHSKSTWLQKLAEGLIEVNDSLTKNEILINPGDVIKYLIKNHHEPEVPLDISLIYVNEEFAVINKTAPIPMQRTSRILVNTFSNLSSKLIGHTVYPLHRLDAETSGLVLFGKTQEIAKQWQQKLPQLLKRKFYLCIVDGLFKKDSYFENSLGETRESSIKSQMHPDPNGKKCATSFYPIELSQFSNKTLLLVEIHTGRKHQIRATLKQLGHPIVGDKIYNHDGEYYLKMISDNLTPGDRETLQTKHQCLHSFASLLGGSIDQLIFAPINSKDIEDQIKLFNDGINKAKQKVLDLTSEQAL